MLDYLISEKKNQPELFVVYKKVRLGIVWWSVIIENRIKPI